MTVARSTGLSTATLSTDTELNRMQYISITTNTRITATVCYRPFSFAFLFRIKINYNKCCK